MDKLKTFLQTLAQITDKEFEDSKNNFQKVYLKKGELLLQKGKVCKQMSFVNRGSLRTFYFNNKAEEITHCFRTEGTFISSYKSFILQEPSILSIIALEDTELVVIDYDKVQKLYSTSLAWQNIGRLLTERAYIEMEEYASVLNNESAKEKYLRLLNEQGEILQKANVEHIATYLGVTRRTLSRIRQEISMQ
ncbi:MAG: Crp/Fnr family transcriptional regulator [Bacteroidetes bacterium]|nr:Crp/Fnr family transcriptional regulator [Bacteroidota bacterium]